MGVSGIEKQRQKQKYETKTRGELNEQIAAAAE